MDIMQAIWDIEQRAKAIVNSADETKEQRQRALENELNAMDEEYKAELARQKERLYKESEADGREEMIKTEQKYAQKLEELENKCRKNREEWVNRIVSAVVD